VLIPAVSLLMGVKEGIVLNSLLLGINNIIKVWYYRKDVRLLDSLALLVPMALGTMIGAMLMLKLHEHVLAIFLLLNVCIAYGVQRYSSEELQQGTGVGYAALSGLCSGLSGTSGPLKGLAVKCFHKGKSHVVATASLLSLVTDALKSGIYFSAGHSWHLNVYLLIASIAMMPLATGLGQKLNKGMSAKAYDALFYTVMSGYVVRLFV